MQAEAQPRERTANANVTCKVPAYPLYLVYRVGQGLYHDSVKRFAVMNVISKMIGVVSVAPRIIYFSYKTGFWTFSRGGCLLILSSVAACYNAWWYNMVARKGHCVISFSIFV